MQRPNASSRSGTNPSGQMGRRDFLFAAAAAAVTALCPSVAFGDSRADMRAAARKGQELYLAGRYAEAVRELAPAAAAMQRDEWVWALYGKALFHSGDLPGARESFRHVLRLSPGDVQARMMLQRISMFPLPPVVPQAPADGKPPPQPGESERRAVSELDEAEALASQGLFRLRRLVLDPGHGGNDPGLVREGAPLEKLLTLDLALRVRDLLSATVPGLPVFLTRTGDQAVPLSERSVFAERMAPDLMLSLHVAGGSGAGPGFAVWSDAPPATAAALVATQENAALGRERVRARQDTGVGEIVRRSLRVRGAAVARKASDAMRAGLSGVVSLPPTVGASLALPSLCAVPCALLLVPGPGLLDQAGGRARMAKTLAQALAVLHSEGA